jgi:hypothetical protein
LITIIFLDAQGKLEPIGKAASQLGLTPKQLKSILCDWENHQWIKDYSVRIGKFSYTFGEPDRFDIVTLTKQGERQGNTLRKIFSLELTL